MINVRRACIDDLESMAAAYVAAWRQGFREMFSATVFLRSDFDDDRRAEVRECLLDDKVLTSVVEIGDRVVGFSGVSSVSDIPCLDDLWVTPHAWGTGAAPALLAAVEDEHRSLGIGRLTTWIPEDSPRARGLFEKAGWSPSRGVEEFGVYTNEPNRLFEYDRILH